MQNEELRYPELTESGKLAAQELVDRFKEDLKKAAENVLNDLYVDIVTEIQEDSWTNFRNNMIDYFSDYTNRKTHKDYNFAPIRKKIFKEYRAELIEDLNKDLLDEIESLKRTIEHLKQLQRY